ALFRGHADAAWERLAGVSGQLGGVDRISLQMTNPRLAHADPLRGIELLGTAVAPPVRRSLPPRPPPRRPAPRDRAARHRGPPARRRFLTTTASASGQLPARASATTSNHCVRLG